MIRVLLRKRRSDKGASLVEFALVAPLLFLLLFGIVEFGWLFFQNINVRQGAREGARLAAVAYGADTSALSAEVLARMDPADSPTVTLCINGNLIGGGTMDPGDEIRVTVSQPRSSLTGLLDWAFPASFTTLTSVVETRAEQTPSGYWSGTPSC